MSRALRNSHEYNTDEAPRHPAHQHMTTGMHKAGTGEQTVVKKANTLTFGSLPPNEFNPDSTPIVIDIGKRRVIALDERAGVKISPALVRFIYDKPLPVRQPSRLESAQESEACSLADAPNYTYTNKDYIATYGEATSSGGEAADSALRVETGSSSVAADSAPAARNAPNPPLELMVDESSDNEDNLYSTVRINRVREGVPLSDYEGGISIAQYKADKNLCDLHKHSALRESRARSPVVNVPSPLPTRVTTCSIAGEARSPESAPMAEQSLPDHYPELDLSGSCHSYTPIPALTNADSEVAECSDIEVDELMREIMSSYGFSDDQYAEVLGNLPESTFNTAPTLFQTPGTDPSAPIQVQRVTVDSVDDEDPLEWATLLAATDSVEVTLANKVISQAGNIHKIRSECRSLDIVADNIKPIDQDEVVHQRSSDRLHISVLERKPLGARSDSYIEIMRGEAHRPHNNTPKPTLSHTFTAQARAKSLSVTRSGLEGTLCDTCNAPESIATCGGDLSGPLGHESRSNSTHRCSDIVCDYRSEASLGSNYNSLSSSSSGNHEYNTYKLQFHEIRPENHKLGHTLAMQACSGHEAQALNWPDGDTSPATYTEYLVAIFGQEMCARDTNQYLALIRYISTVAPKLEKLDMMSIYQGLFDDSFATKFKECLRHTYNQKPRGAQSLPHDFATLTLLFQRPLVTDTQEVWHAKGGLDLYIKKELPAKDNSIEGTTRNEQRKIARDLWCGHDSCKMTESHDENKQHVHRDCNRSRGADREYNYKRDKYKCERRLNDHEDKSECPESENNDFEREESWERYHHRVDQNTAKTYKRTDGSCKADESVEYDKDIWLPKDYTILRRVKTNGMSPSAVVVIVLVPSQECQKSMGVGRIMELSNDRKDLAGAVVTSNRSPQHGRRRIEFNARRTKQDLSVIIQLELKIEHIHCVLRSSFQTYLTPSTILDRYKFAECVVNLTMQHMHQMVSLGLCAIAKYDSCTKLKCEVVEERRPVNVRNLHERVIIVSAQPLFQQVVRSSFNPNTIVIGPNVAPSICAESVISICPFAEDTASSRLDDLKLIQLKEAINPYENAPRSNLPPFHGTSTASALIYFNGLCNTTLFDSPEVPSPQIEKNRSDRLELGQRRPAISMSATPGILLPKKTKAGPTQTPIENVSKAERCGIRALLASEEICERMPAAPEDEYKSNAVMIYLAEKNQSLAWSSEVLMYAPLDNITNTLETVQHRVQDTHFALGIRRNETLHLHFLNTPTSLGHVFDVKITETARHKIHHAKKWEKTRTANKDHLASLLSVFGYLEPNFPGTCTVMVVFMARASGMELFREPLQ